ncbi:phenolic acid decarboxylase [Streptomyces decoyicus]|uniref:Phenolic acid decarboxylase n=1 Tax=Streptomyces decoyicus TaxID=249567 RepID=A0ABZ1FBL0_9ACTN|nr:phenolic acid decarboxylase [Streptomyces decoyicus]WSB67223.1 phenolic acid decarboxylase [Streptomyces decoyicus]
MASIDRADGERSGSQPHPDVPEFAKITFFEDCGENKEDVIAADPADLPEGCADRVN